MELTPPADRERTRVLRDSLDASLAEGAVAEVFGACAGGAVLTGWALYFGATPIVIGLLGALPYAAQIVQLPAAWLTQRVGAKPLAVVALGAARLAWPARAACGSCSPSTTRRRRATTARRSGATPSAPCAIAGRVRCSPICSRGAPPSGSR